LLKVQQRQTQHPSKRVTQDENLDAGDPRTEVATERA
jgi:hypothetical protein